MAYPNPLGYWVSAVSDHPAHPILKELEERFGSYFEALSRNEILCVLAYCAVTVNGWYIDMNRDVTANEFEVIELIGKLPREYKLALIPFLHEQTHRSN